MGHFTSSTTREKRIDKTPPEWLAIGVQLGELANDWSDRDDIVTYVGEGAGQGAPACFVPNISEMEVDTKVAFDKDADPVWIPDLTERDNQFDYPVVMGAVLHEAMHAQHSTWDLLDCAKSVRDGFEHELVTSFEETRIEARGVKKFPGNVPFLRACALRLVIGDLKEDTDFAKRGHQSMSKLMLLTMARVDAGVLKPEDVTIISAAAEKLYGPVLVEKLRGIWVAAQAHDRDDEWKPLHKLALRWIELLEEEGHDPRSESEVPEWLKELLKAMIGASGEGEGSGGEGEGEDGEGEGEGPGSGGILVEMAEETETRAGNDATDQDLAEQAEAQAKAASAAAKEKHGHEQKASQVFGRGTGPGPANTSSTLLESREPTGPERAAAVALSKALERAKYRDRVVEKRKSVLPPGKLKMRSAMAGAVEMSKGAELTAEPWVAKRRFHTEDPDLKVGVLVDISGSMRRAMEPMAGTAWALSEAVRRIQGKAAMVYYGNDVFPTLAPGQHLDKVRVYSASDMTEKFDKAFQALNGKLELLGSSGARLLVVVSDLYHTPDEVQAARKWFARCKREGVAVVVVAPDERMVGHASGIVGQNGTVLELNKQDQTGTCRAIGEAVVRELQRASR